jgi:hypothetical protein
VITVHPPDGDPTASRQVDWWSVCEFVEPLLAHVGCWPMAGTVTWRQLDDTDPAKWAALLDAARHHSLHVDTAQTALAEASRAIASGADWSAAGRAHRRRAHAITSGAYIPRSVA